MKTDFNLQDSFSIFDVNKTGKVSVKDLNEGLIAIGVTV
jgi:Ca2+-binding EF-hand superfamily protein